MPAFDIVTAVATSEEFAANWHAQRSASYLLWDLIEQTGAVAIETTENWERSLCSTVVPPTNRSRFGVLAQIEHETEGDDGALYLRDGASLRELHSFRVKHVKAQSRLAQARMGGLDEDAAELDRAVSILDDRLKTRANFDSSFDKRWIPKQAIRSAFTYEPASDVSSNEFQPASGSFQAGLDAHAPAQGKAGESR